MDRKLTEIPKASSMDSIFKAYIFLAILSIIPIRHLRDNSKSGLEHREKNLWQILTT